MSSVAEVAAIVAAICAVLIVIAAVWRSRRARRNVAPHDVIPGVKEQPMKDEVWSAWMEEHWNSKDPQRRS